jgi:uncharacterized protein YaaQ
MKLVITIVQAYDTDRLLRAVVQNGLHATRISSVGGFLRMGNATILMAVPDDDVPRAIELVRTNCESRVEVKVDPEPEFSEYMEWFPAGVHDVTVGGAVVFVVPISRMVRIIDNGMVDL